MLLFASVPAVAFLVVLGVAIVIRRVRRGEGNTFDRVAGSCALTLLIGLPLSPLLFPGAGGGEYGAVFAFAWLLPAWRGYTVLASDYRFFGRLLLTTALALELLFLLDFSRQIRSNAGGASESFGTSLGRQWLVAGRLAAAGGRIRTCGSKSGSTAGATGRKCCGPCSGSRTERSCRRPANTSEPCCYRPAPAAESTSSSLRSR